MTGTGKLAILRCAKGLVMAGYPRLPIPSITGIHEYENGKYLAQTGHFTITTEKINLPSFLFQ